MGPRADRLAKVEPRHRCLLRFRRTDALSVLHTFYSFEEATDVPSSLLFRSAGSAELHQLREAGGGDLLAGDEGALARPGPQLFLGGAEQAEDQLVEVVLEAGKMLRPV